MEIKYYSHQVLTFLLAAQLVSPQKYLLLKENHENIIINKKYGYGDVIQRLDESLFEDLKMFYRTLPLAAFVSFRSKTYLACHGGAFFVDESEIQNKSLFELL